MIKTYIKLLFSWFTSVKTKPSDSDSDTVEKDVNDSDSINGSKQNKKGESENSEQLDPEEDSSKDGGETDNSTDVSKSEDKYKPSDLDDDKQLPSHTTFTSDGYPDGNYAEINIHSSKKLIDENGRVSEYRLAEQLAYAFSEIGIDYIIRVCKDPVDPPSEKSVCGGENPIQWWLKQIPERDQAKDSNPLLLYSPNGGGCGYIGVNACTCPGYNLTEYKEPLHKSDSQDGGDLSACLHEIGHNLGMKHDHDDLTSGMQHTGSGWNDHDSEAWHRTPMNVANGVTNMCGEDIDERQYGKTVNHLYYHDCTKEYIRLK